MLFSKDNREELRDLSRVNSEKLSFYRMLCPASEEFTKYYLTEEVLLLRSFVERYDAIKNMNLVVVGAGPLLHLSLGYEYAKSYVAVDPISNLFINDLPQDVTMHSPKIKIITKYFEDLSAEELLPGNSLYVFTFNVISYIKNFEHALNNIIKKGDIVFISYWNKIKANKAIMDRYFDFVYGKELMALRRHLIDTDDIRYKKIKHLKRVKKKCGRFVKTMVLYT